MYSVSTVKNKKSLKLLLVLTLCPFFSVQNPTVWKADSSNYVWWITQWPIMPWLHSRFVVIEFTYLLCGLKHNTTTSFIANWIVSCLEVPMKHTVHHHSQNNRVGGKRKAGQMWVKLDWPNNSAAHQDIDHQMDSAPLPIGAKLDIGQGNKMASQWHQGGIQGSLHQHKVWPSLWGSHTSI